MCVSLSLSASQGPRWKHLPCPSQSVCSLPSCSLVASLCLFTLSPHRTSLSLSVRLHFNRSTLLPSLLWLHSLHPIILFLALSRVSLSLRTEASASRHLFHLTCTLPIHLPSPLLIGLMAILTQLFHSFFLSFFLSRRYTEASILSPARAFFFFLLCTVRPYVPLTPLPHPEPSFVMDLTRKN